MMYASRMVVQMLCLLSYLWASTCVANLTTCVTNVLQVHQLQLQEPKAEIIVDELNESLIIHHQGYKDQHEPLAKSNKQVDSDHVVKLACVSPNLFVPSSKTSLAQVHVVDVLLTYLPPPVFTFTASAKTLLLAQQPPPQAAPPPISRNSSVAIVQLTRLRI